MWKLSFFMMASTTCATLIGTRSGLRAVESTSFKFYGQRHVSLNVTGIQSIELEWDGQDAEDLCHGYYDEKILEKNYAGHIVVIGQSSPAEPYGACESFTALYSKLSAINTAAVLVVTPLRNPGRQVFAHDGSRGLVTRHHSMPILEVSIDDIPDIMDAIRAGDVVLLESTMNVWLKLYENPGWVIFLRILPALLSFITAVAAILRFKRLDGNHSVSWIFSKTLNGDLTIPEVVLMTEGATMGLFSIASALGNTTGAIFSYRVGLYVFPLWSGSGLFTSILLLLQLNAIRDRVDILNNADMNKRLREYGRLKVACIAVLAVSYDFIGIIFVAVIPPSIQAVIITPSFIIFSLVQLGVAGSFTRASVIAVWLRRDDPEKERVISPFRTWLTISGGLMFTNSVATVFFGYYAYASPHVFSGWGGVCFYTRVGISLAQVLSVRAINPHQDGQLGSIDLKSIHDNTPVELCPMTPQIRCAKLGGARHNSIKEKFSDFEVALINFETNGGNAKVSTLNDISGARAIAFLRTILQGTNASWHDALQALPPNSQFSINRLCLGVGDTYFDVRVRVPFEGEVLLCFEESSTVVSTSEQLDNILTMVKHDPGLLSLQWNGNEKRIKKYHNRIAESKEGKEMHHVRGMTGHKSHDLDNCIDSSEKNTGKEIIQKHNPYDGNPHVKDTAHICQVNYKQSDSSSSIPLRETLDLASMSLTPS